MSNEQEDLNDEQQMALAIEWFIAMWDEAVARGVGEDAMGMIVLSAATNKLIKAFGQEGAENLLQRTLDNVKAGEFDSEDGETSATN